MPKKPFRRTLRSRAGDQTKMYGKPVLGNAGAIVPAGIVAGDRIPTSTTKSTGKGPKLDALYNLIPFLNPFTAKAAVAVGGGIAVNEFFGPKAARQAIVGRDKVGGQYDVGILGNAYEALDSMGIGGGFFDMDQQGLDKFSVDTNREAVKKSDRYLQAQAYGLEGSEFRPGDTVDSYAARTARGLRRAVQEDDFQSPVNQQLRLDAQTARLDSLGLRKDSLDMQRMGIEGNLTNTRMQILQSGELEKARMFSYDQDLAAKRENDRYKTTAGLIGGLSALGAAFAL